MSDFIKQLSSDTRKEIENTEKYLKSLKKFQIVINPRTAPRKKKKKKISSPFIVEGPIASTNSNIVISENIVV